MIQQTITTINARIADQLASDNVQTLGIAVPFTDQAERAVGLLLAETGQRYSLDDSLVWQSLHLTDGATVQKTRTFGSFTDHFQDVRFILVGVSKSQSGLDLAMRALDGTGYIVVDGYEPDTLTVLTRFLRVKTGDDKNYDPALVAFAIRYHIVGVSDEDYAELPTAEELAQLPIVIPQPDPVPPPLQPQTPGGYSPVILSVTVPGQTVWNVGTGEPRKTVHLGGVLLREGIHYTLNLPYLTLLQDYTLTLTDYLTLT